MAIQKWEEISLYDGKVKLGFYPIRHSYHHLVNGKPERKGIKSVSAITGVVDKSRPLMIWQERLTRDHLIAILTERPIYDTDVMEAVALHRTKKEEAADFGTMVHDWAENFAQAKLSGSDTPEIDDSWPDEVRNGINSFVDWYLDNNVKFLKTEQFVYSKKHDYGGRFDAIAKVNGKVVLIDYKTSSGVWPEMKLQACGYAIAYEEEYGKPVDQIQIIHFDKKQGVFQVLPLSQEEEEKYKKGFIHAVGLVKSLN